MRMALFFTLLWIAGVMPVSAGEADLIAKGEDLAQSCIGCHGDNGIATAPTNPNLAGQNAGYLEIALKAYRSGDRRGGLANIMRPNARGLSDEDIRALAAYFSSR